MQSLLFTFVVVLISAAIWAQRGLRMPGSSYSGVVPQLTTEEIDLRRRLREHVEFLAGTIGERNSRSAGSLERSAQYIAAQFAELGYAVNQQRYRSERDAAEYSNLEVEIEGSQAADEIVLIGAHYDTVPGSPGADDNASGIAALLEIARALKNENLGKTLRLVAFVNEEEPYATTDLMGSIVYARTAKARGEKIVAMLSLESIGYYRDLPASQFYPPPLSWFYSDRGNFLGFVGNVESRALVRSATAGFRQKARLPSDGLSIPESIAPDIARSDHASFWQYGYPAIMVTDTVPFRNPHYHTEEDRPDTLDYDRYSLAVRGLTHMALELAR